MSSAIIAFRRKSDEASALGDFDGVATTLLSEGRASSLTTARIKAILTKLRSQRTELAGVIADLQARPPSGDGRIDTVNANLCIEASKGLAQIDRLIQHAETCSASS
ncbi:hypothetical protein MKK65_12080 [Methylobacterium sp. J-001]|uniref:hypothetical protein n=1 Tax=Methylobacterium sp. J-001 TaxID=2836609 RepID=UPI001FBB8B0F|nr:hypothetical protein [Methylobacterium sp. J-001]MCJ2117288.1 hypothetical protein [Methylobacterium sp. J-001]